MVSTLEPLVRTLNTIENRATDNLTVDELSRVAFLSSSHLQRLFTLTMGQPLMSYVRGRKLAHSLDDLLRSPARVIEIAHRYGFGHEQSYIRAFRKEFGCTPGFARQQRPILPIRQRIDPAALRDVGQGLMCGPDIVMVPSFHVIGSAHLFAAFDEYRDGDRPNRVALQFIDQDASRLPNLVQPPTYIGMTSQLGTTGDVEYFASAQVTGLDIVPEGLQARTVPTHLCVYFRYVGEHPVTQITMATARSLYDSIDRFFAANARYREAGNWFFERIDSSHQDQRYCLMEWMRPIIER